MYFQALLILIFTNSLTYSACIPNDCPGCTTTYHHNRLQQTEEPAQPALGETCEVTDEEINAIPGMCTSNNDIERAWKSAAICESRDPGNELSYDVGYYVSVLNEHGLLDEPQTTVFCTMAHTYAYWNTDPCSALQKMIHNQNQEIDAYGFVDAGSALAQTLNEQYLSEAYEVDVTYESCQF